MWWEPARCAGSLVSMAGALAACVSWAIAATIAPDSDDAATGTGTGDGADARARPLTIDERRRLGALLREHDYPGARLVALRFAHKLTRDRAAAHDVMGRAELRLVRLGWDPREVALVKRLCRLVWSEWTNMLAEQDAARRAQSAFVREAATDAASAPSPEQLATRDAEQAAASAWLERLRASFERAGDEVNLAWLEHTLRGETDQRAMAQRSGRDVTEFYRAADRRKRHVRRLLAADAGASYEEEET